LSHDKVTVDEPLISTDVDNLIRTIAERKRVPLNELRTLCRIDKKTMDKWIAVLEDEGYVSVEYGLRGTYVNWCDMEVPSSAKVAEEAPESPSQSPSEPVSEVKETEAMDEQPVQQDSEEIRPEPIEFKDAAPMEESGEKSEVKVTEADSEPEELLSQYLARKMKGDDTDNESIKSKILTSFGDKEVSAKKAREAVPEEKRVDVVVPKESAEDESEEDSEVEAVPDIAPSAKKPALKVPTADVRELISSYVKEIGKEKAKVESLKKDKEALYHDKFAMMEGKMQVDLVTLTEKVLEKQSKIAELKEGILELPDKVDELEKVQKQMDELRVEGQEAILRVRSKAEGYVASLESSKGKIESKMDDVRSSLEKQSSKLKELDGVRSSLESRSSKLKDALASARAQVEELSAAMNAVSVDLSHVDQTKSEIESMTQDIRDEVANHGSELESLEQELEGIAQVERWAQEYVRDYSTKIEDIERYVAKSEDELSDLREAAEQQYMKKFLGELENLTDAYETELSDAISQDKDIDQKISESKTRINDLASESQEMIKKLRGEVSDAYDYEKVVAKVKAKTAKVGRILEEKSAERSKLLDESRKTRKSKSSRKSKSKVVSKSKKRK